MRYAVAMYVSSVLGSGILVVPGLAAQVAGPGSVLAWLLLSVASYPFAYTFAALSTRKPESGGIYSFARQAFGDKVGIVVAWLFVAWVVLGAPAVTLAAGTYLAFAFPLDRFQVFLAAGSMLFAAFAINYKGIRLSGRVQMATVVAIVALLGGAVIASSGSIRPSNFTPFLPNGVLSLGVASALIVWSYLGYENVSNVAEEFKDPKRDFHRSVVISVLLISTLYMAVAFATVGTGVYKTGGSVTPFASMMSNVFGAYGGLMTSLLAVFIIFGTVNAYMAGMARVVFAAAREGGFPSSLAVVDVRTGAPRRALLALITMIFLSLAVFYFLSVDIQSAFLATSGAAVLAYVVGSAAGVRLLKETGLRRILPWTSLAVSVAILPFIGTLLGVSIAILLLGFLYSWLLARRRINHSAGPAK